MHPTSQRTRLTLPAGLTDPAAAYPTYFIDTAGADIHDPGTTDRINEAIFSVLYDLHPADISGQALIKVHVGEPRCHTRMNPALTAGTTRFLFHRGADGVVAGDTTVAYSGPRGHRQNPGAGAAAYLALAQAHGWKRGGPADIPFVVLDRPDTGAAVAYPFEAQEAPVLVDGIGQFKDFFPAQGFAAADYVVNHAHLTLHGLAGVAGCIKSIAMGCSALPGKLRMHQALLPRFDTDRCKGCGRCLRDCPEKALTLDENATAPRPAVDRQRCIGCGECVSLCKSGAVVLRGARIEDWQLGGETLPRRMADYALGIMNGRWETTLHLLHLYNITKLCDCVNVHQAPIVSDMGFLIGQNPFALDRLAGQLLRQRLNPSQVAALGEKLVAADATARYVGRQYGIVSDGPLHRVTLSTQQQEETRLPAMARL